jgi:phage shock protein PspC (stress-responsive transcriptional regulator)
VVGGVAAGIAEYLDLDPVLVRIAFVALAFLGGSGIVLYLAGWLLIPADDTERALAQDWLRPRSRGRSIAVITIGTVVGLIALSNLFSSGPWWPRWDGGVGGFGFFFGLFALVLAIGLVVSGMRGHRSPVLWVLVTALLSLVAIATVAAATVFSIEAISGVPLHGGIGEAQWRPTAAAQVPANYRLAIGNMTVDLREVTFRPGTTHLTATVGIGHLVVEVPTGTAVSVSAHSGLGDVQVFGVNTGGYSTHQSAQLSGTRSDPAMAAHLVLDAETGVGQVQVLRSS